jgi:FdrA protein
MDITEPTDIPEPMDALLNEPLVVVNVGLAGFATSIEEQDVVVVQVDWAPPAGGDREMIDLLDKLL